MLAALKARASTNAERAMQAGTETLASVPPSAATGTVQAREVFEYARVQKACAYIADTGVYKVERGLPPRGGQKAKAQEAKVQVEELETIAQDTSISRAAVPQEPVEQPVPEVSDEAKAPEAPVRPESAAQSEFLRAAEDFMRARGGSAKSGVASESASQARGSSGRPPGSSRGSVTSTVSRPLESGPSGLPPIPFSAATLGGVPVAVDGDLVYLGGGVYASMATAFGQDAPREDPGQRRRADHGKRVLPGRVKPAAPRQRVRSAGTPGGSQSSTPTGPQRAQSDGDLPASARQVAPAPAGPPIWKPSGPARLPPLPPASQESGSKAVLAPGEAGVPGHCDERVAARDAMRQEGISLFGAAGLLQELATPPEEILRQSRRVPAGSVPTNGARREAERQQLKEAKIQLLLEEKAEREAEESLAKAKRLQNARSAPELRMGRHGMQMIVPPPVSREEEIEQQKMRLAYKMQVIDFFKGYTGKVNRMTADQSKALLRSLHSSAGSSARPGQSRDEPPTPVQEPREAEAEELTHGSVHARLQQASEMCSRLVASEEVDRLDDAAAFA